jgi:hypothetical protein
MTLVLFPMHISVGSMDGHTRLLFYGLCFGPLLIFAVAAYRQQKRIRRELEQEERTSRAEAREASEGEDGGPREQAR